MIRAALLNRHVQTLGGYLLRPSGEPAWRRERLELADGDFVDLDTAKAPRSTARRHALLLHGLEGSSSSGYIRVLAGLLLGRGLDVTVLNFRGCSGTPSRLPRSYHAGDTGDLAAVLEHLRARDPLVPLVAAGFSLGGNVLLKYLGERGASAPIERAAAVSVPFDLAASALALSRGLARVYCAHLLRSLQHKLGQRRQELAERCDLERGLRARNFLGFDDAITAPLHGFGDAATYFARCSSGPFVAAIKTPTLVVQASDDPFVPGHTAPWVAARASGAVRLEVSPWGGHVGFVRWGAPALSRSRQEAGDDLSRAEPAAANDEARPMSAFGRTIRAPFVFHAEERVAAYLCGEAEPQKRRPS